jgi:hypothetical protein
MVAPIGPFSHTFDMLKPFVQWKKLAGIAGGIRVRLHADRAGQDL